MIPCLNPKETREKLEAALKRLKLQVLIKVVIEEGVRGLRVWKL